MNRLAATITALAITVIGTAAMADGSPSDRIQNIESAAANIAVIQKASGSNGAFAATAECYKRELLPDTTTLTLNLEACLAEDIIVSQVTAALYSSMPAEVRKMGGGIDPDAIMKAMQRRVVGTMKHLHVPQDDVLAFSGIVKTKGMEAYAHARFPENFPEKKN